MTDRPFIITSETCHDVRKGLARAPDGAWFHVSPRGDQIILRGLAVPTEWKHSRTTLGEARNGYTYVSYDVLAWYVEPGSKQTPGTVSHKSLEYWQALAKGYDADPSLWAPPTKPAPTDLRLYYEDLRMPGRALPLPSSASTLATLFCRAVEQLTTYRNLREGWAREDNRKPSDDDTFARMVARKFSCGQLAAPWEYQFVARELAPLRATRGDASSSGAGGIDVLLVSDDEDRALPVVVEVKSAKDTGAYLGLVQVLTYASELITSHQRHRLARFYSDRFTWQPDMLGPFADIWIVVERGKEDPEHASTRAIAQEFMQRSEAAALLRRIAFLELDPQTDQLVPA